jgi:hypothetical protein
VYRIPAELLSGPFAVRRAAELGVPQNVLRGRRFRTPVRGVRVPAVLSPSVALDCAACALVLPAEAAFSHATAVRLRGLPLPLRFEDDGLHVSVPAKVTVPVPGPLVGHQVSWIRGDVRRVDGLRVTSVERTLCDLAAAGWPLADLLVLADAALRQSRWTTPERFAASVAGWAGQRGVRVLREVLRLAETRVDSPMETRLRLLLIRAGLPRPVVNEPIWTPDGVYLHTPDLCWPRWRVAVDYDGAHHFERGGERGDWRRRQDVARQELMQENGWVLRIMTATDVLARPQLAVDRTRAALRSRGAEV